MAADKPKRLGRGLNALIPGSPLDTASRPESDDLRRIPLSQIRANPFQPRREFDPDALAELEESLKANGLMQPITVRRTGPGYELVAGERRLRAATSAGWTEITAIVRDLDDRTMLVLAMVENLQRSDLNAIDEARGYRRMIDEFEMTQQQVADAVAKDRTTVTNLLRVLSLPTHVQDLVSNGSLSVGHARALLALGDPGGDATPRLAEHAITAGLSVRALERLVREESRRASDDTTAPATASKTPTGAQPVSNADPAVRKIEDDLRRYFQTDVRVTVTGESRGKLDISFYSHDDLDRILELILRDARRDF